MRKAAAIQHIRHLASLGLGGALVIPEILDTLNAVIPHATSSFFWLDRDGQPYDFYMPAMTTAAFDVMIVNFAALDQANEPMLDKYLAEGPDVGSALRLCARRDFSRSVIVNEVQRSFGVGVGLDLILRENGAPRAIMFINREPNKDRYTAEEYRLLLDLRQHLLHALSSRDAASDEVADREVDIAVLNVCDGGEIVSLSPATPALLLQMSDLPFRPGPFPDWAHKTLPSFLRPLLYRLARLGEGRPAAPAALERPTRWGTFRARAFRQHGFAPPGGGGLTTIIITRHLPRTLALSRRLATLDLSPRERELAFHLGMGRPVADAAEMMGVSSQTGRGYLKSLYRRLDIAGRPALAAILAQR